MSSCDGDDAMTVGVLGVVGAVLSVAEVSVRVFEEMSGVTLKLS